MDYIDEIFGRLNLQQISSFLLHGVPCNKISGKSYKQRMEEAWKDVLKMVKMKFPDEDDEIYDGVYDYAGVTQDVYMEIGIKCGVVLAMQLLSKEV